MLAKFLLFKFGGQLKYAMLAVFATLATLIFLPIAAVVVIANAGVATVSDALISINPITHIVEIFNADGQKVGEVTLATAWPVCGTVSTEFGDPDPPYQLHHTGTDIFYREGTPISPFSDGKVTIVNNDPNNITGYGKYIQIDHGNNITSLYGHMTQTAATVGQQVKIGDVIGYEGNTGHSLGAHVHFETKISGIPVNPRKFISGDPAKC